MQFPQWLPIQLFLNWQKYMNMYWNSTDREEQLISEGWITGVCEYAGVEPELYLLFNPLPDFRDAQPLFLEDDTFDDKNFDSECVYPPNARKD